MVHKKFIPLLVLNYLLMLPTILENVVCDIRNLCHVGIDSIEKEIKSYFLILRDMRFSIYTLSIKYTASGTNGIKKSLSKCYELQNMTQKLHVFWQLWH